MILGFTMDDHRRNPRLDHGLESYHVTEPRCVHSLAGGVPVGCRPNECRFSKTSGHQSNVPHRLDILALFVYPVSVMIGDHCVIHKDNLVRFDGSCSYDKAIFELCTVAIVILPVFVSD